MASIETETDIAKVLCTRVQHDKNRGVDDKEDSIEQKPQAQNANINNTLVADIPDFEGVTKTETKSTITDKVQTHAENSAEDLSQQHGEVSEKQDHEALSPIENTIHGSETTFEASSVTSSKKARLHKEESSVSESRSKSLEEMQYGSTTEAKERELEAEETLAEQPQQPTEIQFSDSQSVENDTYDKPVETGEGKTFRDEHCLSSESPKEDLDDLAISCSTANEILPEKLGKEYHEASPVESENAEKILESVNQAHYSEDISVVPEAEKTFTDDHSVSSKISKDVDDLAISHSTDNEILTVKVGTEHNESSLVEPKNSEDTLESVVQVHDSKVAHEVEKSEMKEESVEAAITEIGTEKIHQEGTSEAKGTTEDYISSEKGRDEDSRIDCTEKEIIQEEFPSKIILMMPETIKSDNKREEARDQEIEASKSIQNQNADNHQVAEGLHEDSTADSMLNRNVEEEEKVYTNEAPKELNLQKDSDKLDSGHAQTEKCSAEEGLKGATEDIVSKVEHEGVLQESTKFSDINNKSSAAVETNKVVIAADSNSSRGLMDHEKPDVRPVETLSEENEASRDFSLKRNEDNKDEPRALSPHRAAFEENSNLQEDQYEEQHCIIGTQPTEDNSIGNDEESNKDKEAKEKNKNPATATTGAADMKGGEADSQTSITEGEDQNSHYSDVKLANLSPKQSSADISHIDEHLDTTEPTNVVPDVIDLSKASPAAIEMEIPEESQPSESTEVILPTAGKDTQSLQKDLPVSTVQNGTQKVESESDPSASETGKVESEEKGESNEPKEVEQGSTSIKPATDSESNLMQGSTSETLSAAEEREMLDQMAQDPISERAKDSNIGTVQKEDQVGLSSNKNTRAEINDTNTFAVSRNKIAEQKDPEESTEPDIFSRDKDLPELKPVSVTVEHEMEETEQANISEAMPKAETVESGESTRTGKNKEEKGTIHDYNQIPESSLSMESTKSGSSDLRRQPAEETIQETEDVHSQPLPYPRVTVDHKNSTDDKNVPQMQEEAAAENFQTGREFPRSAESSPEEVKSEEEQRTPDEITEATGKSAPTEIANTSTSEEENPDIVEHLSERSKLIDKNEELQTEIAETAEDKEVKTNGAKDEEEEANGQRGENSGLQVPLITEKDQEDPTSNKVIVVEMKEDNSNAVPDKKIPAQHPEKSIEAVISREDKDIQPVLLTGKTEIETDKLQHAEASEGAGSNKYEEAKEKNEDEEIIATRGSVTEQVEADGQSSIAEGEDQKSHDPGVKHEGSCPPKKSGLDVSHTDEAPDVSKPTETAKYLTEKNEISPATEEMVILEESQARESTVATITSAGSDVQLPQKDPAVTIQDGIEKLKTEIDPSAASSYAPSPETTKGNEQQKLTDEREEATTKSLPTETTNTSAFDKETLHIDEDFSQKSKLMAKKEELNTENVERDEDNEVKDNEAKDEEEKGEVQREEISSFNVPLMVEKDPTESKSIITDTNTEEDSCSVIPDYNIPLQQDPEERIDTLISSEKKDIQPVLVTSTVKHEIDELKHVDASEGAGSSKDEDAKENNENEATVETRGSATQQDEPDGRSSIAEGEDKKIHDTGVKLESSSLPQKASTDTSHVDEPLDLSKPTEIASNIVKQDEVSFDKEGMGIPEDPQSSESTVVTVTSASRDPEESTEAVISNEDKDIKPVSDELKHGDTSEAAGSNNHEQAKGKNEDKATVEIRGSVTERVEVDGQSNIVERGNQIYHDAGVKLESSSPPKNSSTDIHHNDEPQHLSRFTKISDTAEQNEVSVTSKEMGIPEGPQTNESTVVTTTSAGRDAQITENDPATTAIQAETQTQNIEDDPNAEPSSEKVNSEEEKRLTDDVEEATRKFEPAETANTSVFDKETLQTADDQCEKSKPSAKKEELLTENVERAEVVEVRTFELKDAEEREMLREEHSGSEVPLIVEKDIVDGTRNKTMTVGEIQEDSSSAIPDKKILVQGDPEESREAMISSEDKDIQLVSGELKHNDTSEATGSNNNEQAKEKNEDQAVVRGSVTEQDEAEGQSNIAEGEDQKYHDAGVELESSSPPGKSSTDIQHIDEPQHLSRPTEISDTAKQNEVTVITKGLGIPKEPQSIKSTVVTIKSVGRDAQLTQNDPAATAVQPEIQTPKTEDDPVAETNSEKVKGEEEKRLSDGVEEATKKFEPTETATTSALDKENLQTAEDLCEKNKLLAEKEELQTTNAERAEVVEVRTIEAKDVQREEDSGSEIPLIVEKDIVDGTSNKTVMVAEIEKDNFSTILYKKILVQGDPEESIKTSISSEHKDIQPVSLTETIKAGIDETKHGDAFEAAGSNKADQVKETNEDEATGETRRSVTQRDKADGESSITEGEDQKIRDPNVELNSSSPPEKTSTGICHIDELLELPEPTQIAPDVMQKNEVSVATKAMGIPEESQSTESTEVMTTSAGGDLQLPQDLEATQVEAEIHKEKTENDPNGGSSSEKAKSEEEQTLTNDIEEASRKSLPTETATTSVFDDKTLQIAEDLTEKSKLTAKKEELHTENAEKTEDKEMNTYEHKHEKEVGKVQTGENSTSEVPLEVEKERVHDTSNKITAATEEECNTSVIPEEKILVQGDTEESIETVISREGKDIEPVAVTGTIKLEIDEEKHVDYSEAARSIKDEEAKQKNEDEATVAKGASETKQDEADNQSSIIEGEDPIIRDPDVKLETSSSPKQSSTDMNQIDEPLDLKKSTEIAQEITELTKVCTATKEKEITEESPSSKHTEVTTTSADKDVQLLQNDPAVTAVQDEVGKAKTGNDPCPASEAATLDPEAKGTIDESKKMEQESTPMEPATNSESDIMQGFAEQTLSVAEERETPDQLDGDHVCNHDKSSNMGTVQKEVQVDLSSSRKECPEAMISSGDEDIPQPKPVSLTVELDTEETKGGNASLAVAAAEQAEFGDNEMIGECAEEKENIDENSPITESSKSLELTKSAPTDIGQRSAKDITQEIAGSPDQHEDLNVTQQIQDSPVRSVGDCGISDIKSTQKTEELEAAPLLQSQKHTELEADPKMTVEPENSSSHRNVPQIQEEAATNFKAGKEIHRSSEPSHEEEKCKEEHKTTSEIKEAMENSFPTEIAITSAFEKETPHIAEQSSERSLPKAKKEELPTENAESAEDKEVKTDDSKEEAVKRDVQTGENSDSEVSFTVEKELVDLRSNEIIPAEMKDDSSSVPPEKKIPQENIKTAIPNEDKYIQRVPLTGNVKLEKEEPKHTNAFEAATKANSAECGEEKRTIDEHREIPESSISMASAKSPASDFQQASAKETTGKAEDKKESKDPESFHVPPQAKGPTFESITKDGVNDGDITSANSEATSPLASEEHTVLKGDPKVIPEPEKSQNITRTEQEAACEDYQAGTENSSHAQSGCKQVEAKAVQGTSDETISKGKSPPSETANSSASSAKHFNEESKQVPKEKDESHAETAEKAEGEAVKSDEEERSSYEAPVMVEATRDTEAKVPPRKSHNILSGVGSKVKHSIAKMKKAITCTHTHTIPASPRRE